MKRLVTLTIERNRTERAERHAIAVIRGRMRRYARVHMSARVAARLTRYAAS